MKVDKMRQVSNPKLKKISSNLCLKIENNKFFFEKANVSWIKKIGDHLRTVKKKQKTNWQTRK